MKIRENVWKTIVKKKYLKQIAAYNIAQQQYEDDIFVLFCLNAKTKRPKTHAIYKRRPQESLDNMLIDRYLMVNDTKAQQYFRLTHLFAYKLDFLKDDLEGICTSWNSKPMTPIQFFAICEEFI